MKSRSLLQIVLTVASLFAIICLAITPQLTAQSRTGESGSGVGPSTQPPCLRSKVPEELKLKAQTQPVHVIVQLNVPTKLEATLPNEEGRVAQRQAIKDAQDKLVRELAGTHSVETGRLTTIPGIGFVVLLEGLAVLERSPLVVAVTEDIVGYFSLRDSVPLIEANQAWAAGFDGSGWAMARVPHAHAKRGVGLKRLSSLCFVPDPLRRPA